MGVGTPDKAAQIEDRIKADVQREAPDSNPYLRVHWLRSLIAGVARRQFDFYKDLDRTEDRLFPDTTDEEAALRWGNIYVGPPFPASVASGNAVATGTAGSNIGIGVTLSADGNEYVTTSAGTISDQTINVSSITRTGTTATATTVGDHGLATNVPVTIAGANETEYNVTDTDIVVTGLNTFTYQVTGSPTTPATGTITASFTSAIVTIESVGFTSAVNLDRGSPLQLQSPIAGVDDTLNVDYGAVVGGADEESINDYVSRYLDKIRNPVAHFNVSAITVKAKEIPGVTRVFVEEVTPAVGQVTIYFMRDNDEDPIPTSADVTAVKNSILEIKPANTSDDDVIVSAPTAVPVDYTFSALSPDTSTMRAAIEANLTQFHDEQTFIGVSVDEDAYRSAIKNTVDPDTGDIVISFTLGSPVGDIAIASGEIATLGTVAFP